MSKPYGRTGGLAGGEHKSRQHGSFATCFHRLLSLFWLPLSPGTWLHCWGRDSGHQRGCVVKAVFSSLFYLAAADVFHSQ